MLRHALRAFFSLWVAALILSSPATYAQAQQIQAGREYTRLSPPRPVTTGSRIEVIEFFYYGCPICYELEPALSGWSMKMRDAVTVRRVPALASAQWENFAKLYYTLEALDELTRLHWPVYDNVHADDIELNKESVMLDWVSRNGIDRQKFIDTYGSPIVAARVAAAREALRRYGVKGVPSVIVDGKYLTSSRIAGGTRKLMQVLDYLVERARGERKGS